MTMTLQECQRCKPNVGILFPYANLLFDLHINIIEKLSICCQLQYYISCTKIVSHENCGSVTHLNLTQ